MGFVKAVWKLLVGVKDALVLIFMLMFFGLLYVGLRSEPRPLGDGVLALDLDGTIVEQASRPDTFELLGGGGRLREYQAGDLVAMLDSAVDDDRVKAVALDLDGFLGGGQSSLSAVGEAIDKVRKSGKPVLAYATGYTDDGYQLAAHASEVWINPLGAMAIMGPGGNNLYYKGLLDKLGVTANIYRVGTYKAAVEPYIRNDMSPEARENAQALADALLETWKQDVRQARPQAAAGIERFLADPVAPVTAAGGDFAKAAIDAKLVDKSGERRAFEARLAQLGGSDETAKGGFNRISYKDYVKIARDDRATGPIGVVTVAGMIVDGKAGPGTAGGESIARLIEKAMAKDNLKALVVRVDSPGGSVMASERIRQAILSAKDAGLPVVVSMGDVAASGGYWIATPADFIFAEPSTITGSIGVFGILPSFEGAMAKLGLGADGVKTTPLSGEPDLLNGPSEAADALVQTGVESTYRRFLAMVAQSRKKSPVEIDRIAQGRVWDGGSARQLGLVDGFGGLAEAIEKAAALAKLGDERGVTMIAPEPSFEETLLAMLAGDDADSGETTDALAALAPAPQALLERALGELRAILAGPSIQATCLECLGAGQSARAAVPDKAERGWLALLFG